MVNNRGLSIINKIEVLMNICQNDTLKLIENSSQLNLLGKSINYIYKFSIGVNMEQFSKTDISIYLGRVYNLALSSYILIKNGLYDEAQAHIRTIGEISNLMCLLILIPGEKELWFLNDENFDWRSFTPNKIRVKLKNAGLPFDIPMNENLYAKLSNRSVHLSNPVRPNSYNSRNNMYVGGVVQHKGIHESLDLLIEMSIALLIFVGRFYLNTDDYRKMLIDLEIRNN